MVQPPDLPPAPVDPLERAVERDHRYSLERRVGLRSHQRLLQLELALRAVTLCHVLENQQRAALTGADRKARPGHLERALAVLEHLPLVVDPGAGQTLDQGRQARP